MERHTFENDQTYLPVTMQQFEGITNELLNKFNLVTSPNALGGDYFAQVIMGAIHSLPKNEGVVSKQILFERCVNIVSQHVTFHAVEALKARMEAASKPQAVDNVVEMAPDPLAGTDASLG